MIYTPNFEKFRTAIERTSTQVEEKPTLGLHLISKKFDVATLLRQYAPHVKTIVLGLTHEPIGADFLAGLRGGLNCKLIVLQPDTFADLLDPEGYLMDFATARNRCLSQLDTDYATWVDSDDEVENVRGLTEFANGEVVYFPYKCKNSVFYRERIFPTSCKWEGKIHERIIPPKGSKVRKSEDVGFIHQGESANHTRNLRILFKLPPTPENKFWIARERDAACETPIDSLIEDYRKLIDCHDLHQANRIECGIRLCQLLAVKQLEICEVLGKFENQELMAIKDYAEHIAIDDLYDPDGKNNRLFMHQ